jgi:hypothetical protein
MACFAVKTQHQLPKQSSRLVAALLDAVQEVGQSCPSALGCKKPEIPTMAGVTWLDSMTWLARWRGELYLSLPWLAQMLVHEICGSSCPAMEAGCHQTNSPSNA